METKSNQSNKKRFWEDEEHYYHPVDPNVPNHFRIHGPIPEWVLKVRRERFSQPNTYPEKLSKTPPSSRDSGVNSSSQRFSQGEKSPEETLQIITAEDLMKEDIAEVKSLWGSFIYENCIILLAGEAGVGKTTLIYNLAVSGARGETLCGIPFQRPLKVLYCDLETGKVLRSSKIRLISDGDIPQNIGFIQDLDFIKQVEKLISYVSLNDIDLVIIDTINEAFDTKDEQDNAEANRQFKLIKRLRDEGGCSIILMHHTGKGEQSKKVYSARGASARPGAADVVLTLKAYTEDTICLQKEKDRIAGGKEKLYLKKAGEDMFEVIEEGEDQEVPLVIRAQKCISELIDEGRYTRTEFIEKGLEKGFSRPTIDRAISNLLKVGKLERLKRGIYSKGD